MAKPQHKQHLKGNPPHVKEATKPVKRGDDADTTPPRSPLPKHAQLKRYLLSELKSGRLFPGAALPTEVELAESQGVARNTVRQALAELETEGVIDRIRGRGTFIRSAAGESPSHLSHALHVYGLLVPFTHAAYYPSLQKGFSEAAEKHYKQVIICGTEDSVQKQAESILQLMDKEVAGIAIVPTDQAPTPPHHVRPLQKRGVPVVFCHRRVPDVRAPLVTFSALDVGRTAGQALIEHGHRHVAFATTWPSEMGAGYLAGLREVLRAHDGDAPDASTISLPEPYNVTPQEWNDAATRLLKPLLTRRDRPTAIFASFDTIAERLYLLLGQLGFRIPTDVSLVGFGDARRNGAVIEALTSVTIDETHLGATAGRVLTEMCNRTRDLYDEEKIILPVSLSAGGSLRAITKAHAEGR